MNRRLDQGEPVPPALRTMPPPIVQCAEPARDTGKTCGIVRLCLPSIAENISLMRFSPWPGWQIVGLLFDRTGQEPTNVFGCLLDLFDTSERIVIIISQGSCLRIYMCKIRRYCVLSKDFVGVPLHSFSKDARNGLQDLSDRAPDQETKGVALSGATESAVACANNWPFSCVSSNWKRAPLRGRVTGPARQDVALFSASATWRGYWPFPGAGQEQRAQARIFRQGRPRP